MKIEKLIFWQIHATPPTWSSGQLVLTKNRSLSLQRATMHLQRVPNVHWICCVHKSLLQRIDQHCSNLLFYKSLKSCGYRPLRLLQKNLAAEKTMNNYLVCQVIMLKKVSNSILLSSQISETFFFRNELVSRFFILYNSNNIISLAKQWPHLLSVNLTTEGIPHSRNCKEIGYKLSAQQVLGSFGWTKITYRYNWLMVALNTIHPS